MAKRYAHTRRRKSRRARRSIRRSYIGKGGAPSNDITIGILCWKSPKTITSTLDSYQKNGLFDLVHPVIYIQERSPKYEEIAKKHGVNEILGNEENTGILRALIDLVNATKTKYFIFAECDFKLIHDKETTDKVLKQSIKLIEEKDVQVVRLRDRKNPGEPMIARKFVPAKDSELQDYKFDQDFTYKLETVMFLDNPDEKFPGVFEVIDYDSRWYKCADKGCAPWSNNIFITTTEFMKKKVFPILRARSGVNASGRNDEVFAKLEAELIEKLSGYNVAQGPGLFTHERLDRGDSNS